MEISNKYLLLAAGVALVISALFNVGNGFSGLNTFGFVPISGWGSIVNNGINTVTYILGFWMIVDAIKKFRE